MATRTRRNVGQVSPFESLESRTMFAVTPFSTALSTIALKPVQSVLLTNPAIKPVVSIGTLPRLSGGFDSFTIRDAASDDTPDRALAGGALRVTFSGAFRAGSTVAVQALRNGAVVATVGTFPAAGPKTALINLRSAGLAAGSYEFRAVGTGTFGQQTKSASFPITIQATSSLTGSITGDTLTFNPAGTPATLAYGLGGSDTLSFPGISKNAVGSFNGLPLAFINIQNMNGSTGVAIFNGSVFDTLRLNNVNGGPKEIYLQGVEKLRFSDGTVDLAVRPNDPGFSGQWNLHATDTPGAWRFTKGASNVLLASLDSGILTPAGGAGGVHDISNARLVTDSTDDDNITGGSYGHGHKAISVMAATANNGANIAGINWNSRVYVNDVYNGVNLQQAITNTLDYARANGMKVVFQGGIQGEGWLTSGGTQSALETLIRNNRDRAFFAIAAGNGGPGGNLSDANYLTSVSGVAKLQTTLGNVASVGALQLTASTSVDGNTNAAAVDLAGYSNRGSNLTLVAPTNVPSVDKNGNTVSFGGTSAANPNLAGMASLVWSANPSLTGEQLRTVLTQTTMDLGTVGRDNTFGRGLVNVEAAVRRAAALARDPALANLNPFGGSIFTRFDVRLISKNVVTIANRSVQTAFPTKLPVLTTTAPKLVTQASAATLPPLKVTTTAITTKPAGSFAPATTVTTFGTKPITTAASASTAASVLAMVR